MGARHQAALQANAEAKERLEGCKAPRACSDGRKAHKRPRAIDQAVMNSELKRRKVIVTGSTAGMAAPVRRG
jgi:hypothetical protein